MSQFLHWIPISALILPMCFSAAVWALAVWALKQDGDTSRIVRRLTDANRLDQRTKPPK